MNNSVAATPGTMRVLRRIGRVAAVFVLIVFGGIVCGGIVHSAAMYSVSTLPELNFWFMEGAGFGGATAVFLGAILCWPVSYCHLGRYTIFAAVGALGPGITAGVSTGYDGLMLVYLAAVLGFLVGSVLELILEAIWATSEEYSRTL